jgi:hypothetical protein
MVVDAVVADPVVVDPVVVDPVVVDAVRDASAVVPQPVSGRSATSVASVARRMIFACRESVMTSSLGSPLYAVKDGNDWFHAEMA